MTQTTILRAGLWALLGCAASFGASITTNPAGLAPGTQYQLVFVTNDSVLGNLSDISDYNTFVTNQAAQNAALATLPAPPAIDSSRSMEGNALPPMLGSSHGAMPDGMQEVLSSA